MSVGKQLHQTLASLRGAKADMEAYALSTEDKNAQKLFSDCCNQLDNVIKSFEGRVNYIEKEEPQYKVKKQMQQQNKQQ
ncbi:MAG TPA: DUF1657 domain-containing protein [Halanaerobiaceae bacterium]|jgi:hypothetical protein|nr:DUF1657 domain-containing protein [Halanaerobiaceae bacterium]